MTAKLTETCRCGASMTAETDTEIPALVHLTAWRENHSCAAPGSPVASDPVPSGAGTHLGFAAAPAGDRPVIR
jgi:hypothetical protein